MYSAFTTVFIIGTVMILVGFVGRLVTKGCDRGVHEVSKTRCGASNILVIKIYVLAIKSCIRIWDVYYKKIHEARKPTVLTVG